MLRAPLLVAALALSSCNVLQLASWGGGAPLFTPPGVDVGSVSMVAHPPLEALARWYCPDLLGAGGSLACDALLGPAPGAEELAFVVSVPLDVSNPNAFPLPALEALVSLTLFPATADRALGAACISFCDEGATCGSLPGAGTCTSTEPELRDAADFAAAAFRLLTWVVTDEAPALSLPTIEAQGTRRLTLALAVDAETLLGLLAGEMASRWEDYLADGAVALDVPWAVEGTVWLSVEGLGRVGVGFGPLYGEWTLR